VKRVATDSATRAEALRRAEETSAAQAGRELGIPASTVRAWKMRAEKPAARSAEESETQGQRHHVAADRHQEVGEAALRAALAAIEAGDSLKAQRLMISAGIAADKSSQHEEHAARADERHVRLQTAQGQVIVELERMALDAFGIRVTEAVRAVFGELFRHASAGEPLVVSPALAEAARRDVWEQVTRGMARALPPPTGEEVVDGQLTVEDVIAATPEPEPEPADAEVVEDLPPGWLDVNGGNEPLARAQFEKWKAEKLEREERQHDAPDGWRTGVGSGRGGALYELHQEPRGGPGSI